MEVFEIKDNIEKKIARLEAAPEAIKQRAENAAKAEANYEKELGIAIANLESGKQFQINGDTIKYTNAATIKEKAKAIVHESRMQMLEAQMLYKAAVKNADIICAQLNGWQSVLRYFDK